jgi:thiamine pyrophosphokinase
MGSRVVRKADQNSNDLDKCLSLAKQDFHTKHAVCVGGLGGRLDHELGKFGHKTTAEHKNYFFLWCVGNLNCLYRAVCSNEWVTAVLVDGHNLTQVLPKGDHQLRIDTRFLGPTCGLIPLGCSVERVSTSGLEWDMTEQRLEFGGLVSSSNRLARSPETGSGFVDEVYVSASQPILWTCELQPAVRAPEG